MLFNIWLVILAVSAAMCALIPLWKSRTAAVRELQILKDRLARSDNEIAGLTEQLDGVRSRFAHDLRGPLQSVLGYAELLAAKTAGPLNSKQMQFVENLRDGADKIALLIEGRVEHSEDQVLHGNSR